MMRAAILTGNGQLEVIRCTTPAPGPGHVRVQLEGTGVCASNLPVWEGRPWFQYPLDPGAPGHEGWGIVDAVGDGVSVGLLGLRVAMMSSRAYAEWDVTHVNNVVPIPKILEDAPVPGEPLACAVNVMRRALVQPTETVVVIGIGFLGALLVRLASHAGAHVIAVSRRTFALDIAKQLGANDTLPFCDRDPIKALVAERTSGEMADCVIEAVGTQPALDLATDLTRVRGRIVIAGYHQDGPRQVNMQVWNWRGFDIINAHERDEEIYVRGLTEAVILLKCGVIDLDPLLTHRVSLEEIDQAFRLMQERPEGFLKAYVEFEGVS
jgi:threonine dehydrogenase-like Zn-dependent dehydrogenase